ncbi:hypothetical protein Golomagni_01408 [Golovinomyces magnicellulatus]|nr:hypothetical protein Golomagni_01408 [Golovinomyces magnicellulatus]
MTSKHDYSVPPFNEHHPCWKTSYLFNIQKSIRPKVHYQSKYRRIYSIAGQTTVRSQIACRFNGRADHDVSVLTLGAFGGVAGFFALFFFGDVPRVRKDIYEKIPVFGHYFEKKIPPSDNVSLDITY